MNRTLAVFALAAAAVLAAACGPADAISIIGRPGLGDGEFREPRAVDASEHGLVVIDKSGRMQLFDLDGRHRRTVRLSATNVRRGLPCGVTWLADGTLAVADTHQSQITLYDQNGALLGRIGQYGARPGELLFPQRIDEAPDGSLAVSQYGFAAGNRVQVFTRQGVFVRRFGGNTPEQGGLTRPIGLLREPDGGYLVADQAVGLVRFASDGTFSGSAEGEATRWSQLLYGLCRGGEGRLHASDIGKHRIAQLDPTGRPLGFFGEPGPGPGQFHEPWDLAWHAGFLYVADRMNHRVQKLRVNALEWRAR